MYIFDDCSLNVQHFWSKFEPSLVQIKAEGLAVLWPKAGNCYTLILEFYLLVSLSSYSLDVFWTFERAGTDTDLRPLKANLVEKKNLSLSLASLPLSLFLRHLPAQEEEEEVKEKRRERSKRKEINESDLTFSGLKLLAFFVSSNKDFAYYFQSSSAVQSKSIWNERIV